jgi:hypothetical protein
MQKLAEDVAKALSLPATSTRSASRSQHQAITAA